MTPDLLQRFANIVGERHALVRPEDQAAYLSEWRGRWVGKAALVLRPGSTDEVARIMALAHETGAAIVPQSGNTGLVGGQIPFESGEEIVLSLNRMTHIRSVDASDGSMILEAGVTLAAAQEAAAAVDRLFPLSLASEGSCQIGGTIASNAGGTGVLAYGSMRDLVLGLEVVLADGRVWSHLGTLRKDNTGYDLKHLFIGSEGTLGIITAAALKLFARPREVATAFIALDEPSQALKLLARARTHAGQGVTAIEILPAIGLQFLKRHMGLTAPVTGKAPWSVLLEISGTSAAAQLEAILADALSAGEIADAALAQSADQAKAMWRLRESMSEVQKHEGGSIKHDVSVPVAAVPEFLARVSAAVTARFPGARPVPFGHIGDGNIHFNVSQPEGADKDQFLNQWEEMASLVHGIVRDFGGSISAEHGIGRLKREEMRVIKTPLELELMRGLKQLLDPKNILNPGKLLPGD